MVCYKTMRNLSLHALRNSPFRSKGANSSIFSPFSSISQRLLLSQQTQQNVEVNARRFYCVHPLTRPLPPLPPSEIPQDFLGFLEWYFSKSFETVPYTNRTRRFLYPRNIEIWYAENQFKEKKEQWMKNEGMLLSPTHPDVVRVNMILNNIIYGLKRELKKKGNAKSSYNSILERIWMSLKGMAPPASTLHLDGLDWEVLVVKDLDDNAFSMSFGKILIDHNFVKDFGSDIEIATIISHEVAHTVAGHQAERFKRKMKILTINYILGENFTKHIGLRILPLIKQLPFNRRLEMEADYIGLLLLASAGYDPQQVPQVYEKINRNLDNRYNYKLGGYLRSHPLGRERAKALAQEKIMKEALAIYNDVRADHGVSERV